MAVVRMQHIFFKGERPLYFYTGEAAVRGGIATIKHDRPEWVSRTYIMGYRIDPESGEEKPMHFFKDQNVAPEGQSAKSAEGTSDEGTDGRGLPAGDDGLRTSEPAGAGSVPDGGLDGSSGDGPTVDGEGD